MNTNSYLTYRNMLNDNTNNDCVWTLLVEEAKSAVNNEPILASYFSSTILEHKTLVDALTYHLANKLSCESLPTILVYKIISSAFLNRNNIVAEILADITAIFDRDPAAHGYLTPFLHFKGFHALQCYRVSNWLWNTGRRELASFMQNRISEKFGVDIHPAAKIGKGIPIDHATSVVVGETAVVEDNVSMLHEVTLGGTGKTTGDRHPKVKKGVLIGAGAKILGNVIIGEGSKIAAGSIVLKDVPPKTTVAGVPAKIIGSPNVEEPALLMDHHLNGYKF